MERKTQFKNVKTCKNKFNVDEGIFDMMKDPYFKTSSIMTTMRSKQRNHTFFITAFII